MSRGVRVLTWAGAAALLLLLVVMVLVPRLAGWVPLTVLSGSMSPTIPTGSMVVVERIDGEADLEHITVGDVITFLPRPDDPTLVTHRVVSRGTTAEGAAVFVTRGDANGAEDPEPVGAKQVRAKVRYHVPHVGRLSTLLNVEQKQIGLAVVAGGLFTYAGWHAIQALRTPRAAHHGTRPTRR